MQAIRMYTFIASRSFFVSELNSISGSISFEKETKLKNRPVSSTMTHRDR